MSTFEQILKANNLHHIYPTLTRLGINSFTSLKNYKSSDLEDLGILDYIDRIKLLKIIRENGISGKFDDNKIIVCVRKRPLKDENDDAVDICENQLTVNEPKLKVDLQSYTEKHEFIFDEVFEKTCSNDFVYNKTLSSIVKHVNEGGCGAIIAYGQTGTGKTYTMMEENTGIIYRALADITKIKPTGFITFCEIYMGNIYDLINKREKIILREVGGIVHLTNSTSLEFKSYNDICKIINKGLNFRRTGVTGANSKSSRSHAVLIVSFDAKKSSALSSKNSLIFVDLAGSERGTDRKASTNEIKNEGAEINKSLLALKECIRGIELDKKHLPFRQSKLTQILKNSFIGESKTCIIATISPSYENLEHTLNTLRYASRIKDFKKSNGLYSTNTSSNEISVSEFSPTSSSFLTNSSLLFSPSFKLSEEIESKDLSILEKKIKKKKEVKKLLEEVSKKIDTCDFSELVDVYNKLETLTKYLDR
ncbi:kinesin-like protein (KIF2C) [Vairimorpha necatrix]|uniref:Kinesin-like protein (KIF2C) n=1 Tax=Vairimorpha necatrix TaxID=6039 RepID=A0AAX4J8U0_9MICR